MRKTSEPLVSRKQPLYGTFQVKVEENGRFVFPDQWRNVMDGSLVMVPVETGASIYVCDTSHWRTIIDGTDLLPVSKYARGKLNAEIAALELSAVEFDGEGGVRLPPGLRKWVHVGDELVLIGCGYFVELASPDTFIEMYQDESARPGGNRLAQLDE